MERCPCCHARLKTVDVCPRCEADLKKVIDSEMAAKYWLGQAIKLWQDRKVELSVDALKKSVFFKKMDISFVFRDFIIQQQCQHILDLLEKNKLSEAKNQLHAMRALYTQNQQLYQLNLFFQGELGVKNRVHVPKSYDKES